jgi:hypothetical protein
VLGSSDVITPEVPIGAEGVESQELRRPGANGRQSGRQRPIGEVDRANQNRFASSRQMRLVFPWRRLCVRRVLPSEVFLVALVATDIRERLRGVCPRLLYKDRRRLAQCSALVRPYLYSVRNIIANTGPSSRFRTPKWQAAALSRVIVKSSSNIAEMQRSGLSEALQYRMIRRRPFVGGRFGRGTVVERRSQKHGPELSRDRREGPAISWANNNCGNPRGAIRSRRSLGKDGRD